MNAIPFLKFDHFLMKLMKVYKVVELMLRNEDC